MTGIKLYNSVEITLSKCYAVSFRNLGCFVGNTFRESKFRSSKPNGLGLNPTSTTY